MGKNGVCAFDYCKVVESQVDGVWRKESGNGASQLTAPTGGSWAIERSIGIAAIVGIAVGILIRGDGIFPLGDGVLGDAAVR